MQSLTTTFSDREKTSEAKFKEKRQNLDSNSIIGEQNYKEGKNVQQTVHKSKIPVLTARL